MGSPPGKSVRVVHRVSRDILSGEGRDVRVVHRVSREHPALEGDYSAGGTTALPCRAGGQACWGCAPVGGALASLTEVPPPPRGVSVVHTWPDPPSFPSARGCLRGRFGVGYPPPEVCSRRSPREPGHTSHIRAAIAQWFGGRPGRVHRVASWWSGPWPSATTEVTPSPVRGVPFLCLAHTPPLVGGPLPVAGPRTHKGGTLNPKLGSWLGGLPIRSC